MPTAAPAKPLVANEVIPFSELVAMPNPALQAAGINLPAQKKSATAQPVEGPAPEEISFDQLAPNAVPVGGEITTDQVASVDSFPRRTKEELIADNTFNPTTYFGENPDVAKDPKQLEKLIETYRARRAEGITPAVVGEAAKNIVPVGKKFLAGAHELASGVVKLSGIQDAVNSVLGFGESKQQREEMIKEGERQKIKAAAEITAGSEAAGTGLADLARTGIRKLQTNPVLGGVPVEGRTQQELLQDLSADAAFHKQLAEIGAGRGEVLKAVNLDAPSLAKEGIILDPDAIENLSLVDPLTLVAAGGAFKVLGVGGKLVATVPTVAKGAELVEKLGQFATKTLPGNLLKAGGIAAEATGKFARPISGAATVGGVIHGGAKGALLGLVPPILEKGGAIAADVGKQILGEVPRSKALEALATAAPLITTPLKGAAVGAAAAVPLAAAAEGNEQAGAILGGGAALGLAHGAVSGGAKVTGELAAKTFFDPHTVKYDPQPSPGYGRDAALDTANDANLARRSVDERGAVTTLREIFRPFGAEIYSLDGPTFAAQLEQSLGRKPTADEIAAQGYLDKTLPGGEKMVLLNSDSKAANHEVGHVIDALLTPEAHDDLSATVNEFYTPEQLASFKSAYESRIGAKITDKMLVDEIIAENFSAVLNNVPVKDLTAPPGVLRKIGSVLAGAAESLGVNATQGRGLPNFKETPIFQRVRAQFDKSARELLAQKPLQPAAGGIPPELGGPAKPPVAPSPPGTPVTAPGPAPITPARPPTPPARNIRVTKEQQDALAQRAAYTGIPKAKELAAKDTDPNVAARVNEVSAHIEAGNPVLEIEHLGIVSEGEAGAPAGRAQRRGEQAKGYDELEAIRNENRANAPADIVNAHQKTFVPVRWTDQGGTPTLIAMSSDKVISNIHQIAELSADKNASALLPVPSENGKLTDAGWNKAIDIVQKYSENHANGFRGDGQRLIRPAEGELSIPAENKAYAPHILSPEEANFANLVMGLATPETAREIRGKIHGNIKGQILAEANKRPLIEPGAIKPKNIGKQEFKSFPGKTLKEVNPLRQQLEQRGVDIRQLHDVTERIRAKDIASVKPRTDLNFKAPETDVIRGGFLPAEKFSDQQDPITEAAVRDSKGRVVTGAFHGFAEDEYLSTYLSKKEKELVERGTSPGPKLEDGFVTRSGKFLSREAAQAHALEIKQLSPNSETAQTRSGLEADLFHQEKAFLPAEKESVQQFTDRLNKASPDEFTAILKASPTGALTPDAWQLGLGLKNVKDLQVLLDAGQKSLEASRALGKAGDFDAAFAEAGKSQYFREAYEAATDTGSAATPIGWRRRFPDAKSPFPGGKPFEQGAAKFLPAEEKKPLTGGRAFAGFFQKTEQQAGGGSNIRDLKEVLVQPTEGLEPELTAYAKYGSNFQKHIASSIPGLVDSRLRLLKGLSDPDLFPGKQVNYLDIGSSEGYVPKAWTDLAQQRGVDAHSVSLDPLPEFQDAFEKKTPQVKNATFELAALKEGFEDPTTGKQIPAYDPGDKKFDIVHEGLTFQFFTPERAKYLAEAKRMMTPDGVFVTTEKFKNPDYAEREVAKDKFKSKFFTQEQIQKKAAEVLEKSDEQAVGMKAYQVPREQFEKELADNWKHVEQIWSSGNFAGYIASDSPRTISKLRESIGNTNTEFSAEKTPRVITDEGPKFLPRKRGAAEEPRRKSLPEGLPSYLDTTEQQPISALSADLVRTKGATSQFWLNAETGKILLAPEGHTLAATPVIGKTISNVHEMYENMFKRGWVRGVASGTKAQPIELNGPLGLSRAAKRTLEDMAFSAEREVRFNDETLVEKPNAPQFLPRKKKSEGENEYAKYNVEPAAKTTKLTGWVLPNKEFVPLNDSFHEQFLASNAEDLNKRFGTKFSGTPTEGERLDALNAGFARVRYEPRSGIAHVEVNAKFWDKQKAGLLDQILSREDSLDGVRLSVLNDKGQIIDSTGAKIFEKEGSARAEEIQKAFDEIRPGGSKGAFLPPEQELTFKGFEEPSPEKKAKQLVAARVSKAKEKYPEALTPKYARDENGDVIPDKDGKPKPVSVTYDLENTPLGRDAAKGLRGEDRTKAVGEAIGDKLVGLYKKVAKNPEIEAGSKWYSTARVRLKKLFGDSSKFFAELLGATSARTPVETNFRFALDAYNQFKAGKFNETLAKYREGKSAWDTSGPEVKQFIKESGNEEPTRGQFLDWWVTKNNLAPLQSNGKKFGANSRSVLRVLDGSWREEVRGPKTPNFSSNLTGESFAATVDVWAARTLHRLANEGNTKPWRILPEFETGVTDEDFFLGQAAYKHAADKLGIKPDALQAVLWFAEKHLWEQKGWTRGAGAEKSDFNTLLADTEKVSGEFRRKTPQKELALTVEPGEIRAISKTKK